MPGQKRDLVLDDVIEPVATGEDVEVIAGVVPHFGAGGERRLGGGLRGAPRSKSAICTRIGQAMASACLAAGR